MTGPVTQMAVSGGWVQTAIVGTVSGVLCWAALGAKCQMPKWICVLQLVWIALAGATLFRESAGCWPMGNAYPVVPLAIFALAAWSAQKGAASAAAAWSTLLYIVAIGFALVLAAGLGQVRWERELAVSSRFDGRLMLVFVIPCTAAAIPREGKQAKWGAAAAVLFAVISSVVVQGVLSINGIGENGFYQMSRGLSLLGVWERFEALVCALMTIGWVSAASLLFSSTKRLCTRIFNREEKISPWMMAFASAALSLCDLHTNSVILWIFGVISWGVFPLLTQWVVAQKKM